MNIKIVRYNPFAIINSRNLSESFLIANLSKYLIQIRKNYDDSLEPHWGPNHKEKNIRNNWNVIHVTYVITYMQASWHFVYSYLLRLDNALAVQEVQSLIMFKCI